MAKKDKSLLGSILKGTVDITGEIINVDSGQRLAWLTPDIINVKE